MSKKEGKMTKLLALGMFLAFLHRPQVPPDLKNPEELKKVYDSLMKAFETADATQVQSLALEGAVTITAQERKENPEYGTDINLPFLKNGFDKKVARVVAGSDGTYLIRTSSSYLRFVHYRNVWKLYRYGDKPIE